MDRACKIIFRLTSLHVLIPVITSLMALLNESQRLPAAGVVFMLARLQLNLRPQLGEVFFLLFFSKRDSVRNTRKDRA